MGHTEQEQKIPDSTEITVKRKDQSREYVHYRIGVTSNA